MRTIGIRPDLPIYLALQYTFLKQSFARLNSNGYYEKEESHFNALDLKNLQVHLAGDATYSAHEFHIYAQTDAVARQRLK